MKNFFVGIIIGITSLIPGISAGTIIYLSNDCNYIYNLIINYKQNYKKIIIMLLGIIISIIIFSKIIEYLFYIHPYETIYLIIGLLLSTLKESIHKQEKYNFIFLLLGILVILSLNIFNTSNSYIITTFPKLTILFLLSFSLYGFIDGFFTITPGISGSMIMMILGPYYLYKSYLANLTNNILFIIPLIFYFIGDTIGLFIGSKTSLYFLNKYHIKFTSLIFGMVITSIFLLIPHYFDFKCLILLIIGYIIKK